MEGGRCVAPGFSVFAKGDRAVELDGGDRKVVTTVTANAVDGDFPFATGAKSVVKESRKFFFTGKVACSVVNSVVVLPVDFRKCHSHDKSPLRFSVLASGHYVYIDYPATDIDRLKQTRVV